jgi:hypothetical protein
MKAHKKLILGHPNDSAKNSFLGSQLSKNRNF